MGPWDDGRAFAGSWVWPPEGTSDTRYLVALHGSADHSEREVYWWLPRIQALRACSRLDVGLVAPQWHDPEADAEEGYLDAEDLYALIEDRLSAEVEAGHAAPSGHAFHGFSRGSARQYELALLDRALGSWAEHYIADAGAWVPGSAPPPQVALALENGDEQAASGANLYVFYGLQDHNPAQNGREGQENAAAVLQSLGATVTLVSDETGCHSVFEQGAGFDRAWPALLWAFEVEVGACAP